MRKFLRDLSCATVLGCVATAASAASPNVTGYHNGGDRSGLYVVPGLTYQRAATAHLDTGFAGHVPGHIYAQPLYWHAPGAAHGVLVVATEDNIVMALDAQTGAEVWRRNVGSRVPQSKLPCGDVDPIGVTGTPVIDAASGVVYLDSLQDGGGKPRHVVHALSIATGKPIKGWPVNVASAMAGAGRNFRSDIENQRSALTLFKGAVLIPFGGNSGDCLAYHGMVVGLDATTGKLTGAWVTRGQKGGIWAQAGVASDGTSIFATTGNTAHVVTSWSDGEAVFRLGADLTHSTDPKDYFTPTNWPTLDQYDQDLGSTGPLPIDLLNAKGTQPVLFQVSKDGYGRVLHRDNLGGVSEAPTTVQLFSARITTGPAVYPLGQGVGVAMYASGGPAVGCPSGIANANLIGVRLATGNPPALATQWCVALVGRGAPAATTTDGTTDPIVWVMGAEGDELLHGYRGDTGAVVFDGGGARNKVANVRHFATPIAAEGKLYVAGDGRIAAFAFGP